MRDDIVLPFYSFAVKVLPDRDIFAEDTLLCDKALQKWLQVFEVLGFPGTFGFSVLAEQAHGATGTQSDALRVALGIKSPRTAVKRAQTLLRYFCMDRNAVSRLGTLGSFLVLEISGCSRLTWGSCIKGHNVVGGAQCFEVCDGHANSRGPDFRSSVERQSATSHGLQGVLQTCEASQGQGIGCAGEAVSSDLDVRDIYMLGAIIFAVLSRSRWSDLRFVDQFGWNVQSSMVNLSGLLKPELSSIKLQRAWRRSSDTCLWLRRCWE